MIGDGRKEVRSEMFEQACEPVIAVGLITGSELVLFELKEWYLDDLGRDWPPGNYRARPSSGGIAVEDLDGRLIVETPDLLLTPSDVAASFVIREVPIGIDFHWEQRLDQEFTGILRIRSMVDRQLTVINEVPLEDYLVSVISSEMSATADPELLRAHAIISRSWLLAQLAKRSAVRDSPPSAVAPHWTLPSTELIRWYDRENHDNFDVCADDHCQRYQGITTATTTAAALAVEATHGMVLCRDGELCDARFSKSCGGMTERFSTAWNDHDYPYLGVLRDAPAQTADAALPLTIEMNAETWIRTRPAAFCNSSDVEVLRKILPDFDQETTDFYRWRVILPQSQLQSLLRQKLGLELGRIERLEPVERGGSGRIIRLRIVGEAGEIVIGKELEIRRALSPSHLYSSAFIVEPGDDLDGFPDRFTLLGAGWGHGVGLCQIGAAIMAETGYHFDQILRHYYLDSTIETLYVKPPRPEQLAGSIMETIFYRYSATERRLIMADTGFVRGDDRIWSHPDGHSIGEGVALALADEAFFRFLKIRPPEIEEIGTTGKIEPVR